MSLAAASPGAPTPDEPPQPGRHVGTLPTGPHAEAEAAALRAAHSGAELVAYVTQDDPPTAGAPVDVVTVGMPAYVPSGLVEFGLILSPDQLRPIPAPYDGLVATLAGDLTPPSDRDPGEQRRDPGWLTEPPSYSRTSTGRVLAGIDDAIGENLRARNQALRAQLRDVTADLASERSRRQDAQARVAALEARVAELDRFVKFLRMLIRHAISHDKSGASAAPKE